MRVNNSGGFIRECEEVKASARNANFFSFRQSIHLSAKDDPAHTQIIIKKVPASHTHPSPFLRRPSPPPQCLPSARYARNE